MSQARHLRAAESEQSLLHIGLIGLSFEPEEGGNMFLRNGLQGVISQKIELFITIAMKDSKPTEANQAQNSCGKPRRTTMENKVSQSALHSKQK
jgi:hypothetical protein